MLRTVVNKVLGRKRDEASASTTPTMNPIDALSPSIKSTVGMKQQPFVGMKHSAAATKHSAAATKHSAAATKQPSPAEQQFLDLNQALVPQMFFRRFTKEFYLEQVHKPRFQKGSALFFNQPYLEVFTRTPWYVVPLFWTPVIALHLIEAWSDFSSTAGGQTSLVTLCAVGVLAWTILEYIFHRFLFHIEHALPTAQWAYALHFLLHGVHHFLPMDRLRLVMPPILFASLSAGPYFLIRSVIGQRYLNPLYCGAVSAYICYDMAHYFFHHGTSRIAYINRMKSHHMAHHYKNPNRAYGVTSVLWDRVFGTTLSQASK